MRNLLLTLAIFLSSALVMSASVRAVAATGESMQTQLKRIRAMGDFERLGLVRTASPTDAAHAFRKLGLLYHPDRVASLPPNERKAAEEIFKFISAANDRIQKDLARDVSEDAPAVNATRGENRGAAESRTSARQTGFDPAAATAAYRAAGARMGAGGGDTAADLRAYAQFEAAGLKALRRPVLELPREPRTEPMSYDERFMAGRDYMIDLALFTYAKKIETADANSVFARFADMFVEETRADGGLRESRLDFYMAVMQRLYQEQQRDDAFVKAFFVRTDQPKPPTEIGKIILRNPIFKDLRRAPFDQVEIAKMLKGLTRQIAELPPQPSNVWVRTYLSAETQGSYRVKSETWLPFQILEQLASSRLYGEPVRADLLNRAELVPLIPRARSGELFVAATRAARAAGTCDGLAGK